MNSEAVNSEAVNSDAVLRITFVRHGESVANRAQRWQGQGDSPLSERGRAQAQSLGARLALGAPGAPAIRVVSSDLSRAVDTARALGLPFTQQPALREFDVGRWEGLSRDEVEAQYPEEMARLKAGEDLPLGGGESYRAFSARIDAAVDALRAQAEPGEHLFVVCHGGVIGTLLARLCGFRESRRFPLARLSNTSLTDLTFRGERAALRVFNDTTHLAHEAGWPGFPDAAALVALCAADGPALHGPATHYALDSDFPSLGPAPEIASCVEQLQGRHPEERVALRAASDVGWRYLARTLWPEGAPPGIALDDSARLHGHVGLVHGRLSVLDFGAFNLGPSA